MRAIPPSLLPSAMTWRAPSTDPMAMDGEHGEPVAVERVRFEESRQRAAGGYSSEYQRYDGPSGRIFVDAVNSSGEVPPVGALVSVDGGSEMAVKKVDVHRCFGEVHHYEIEVG